MAAIASAGSGNWSSTTPNAPWPSGTVPVDGDTVTIGNGHTVTIDQNTTIGADTATAAINVASGGKLQAVDTAAAPYTLILKGDMTLAGLAEFGTASNPIPLNRLFTIKTNKSGSPSDGKYGIIVNSGGVLRAYGATMGAVAAKLASNASAAATSLTTDISTGWKNGDTLVIASTSRTHSETEAKALTADASGTGLTIAALTNAHSGTSPTQAEIINLSRSVVITSDSTTAAGYIQVAAGGVIDCQYVEFSYLGANTTNKRGIEFQTTATCNFQYNSLHDFRNWGIVLSSGNPNNITISNNVCYNLNTQVAASTRCLSYENGTSGTNIVISGNYFIGCNASNNNVVHLGDVGNTFTNNTVAGCNHGTGSGIEIDEGGVINTYSGNTSHSNSGIGMRVGRSFGEGTILNNNIWFNGSTGLALGNSGMYEFIIVDGGSIFGNTTDNIKVNQGCGNILLKNLVVNSHATFTTATGYNASSSSQTFMQNCTFGATVAHSSQDIILGNQLFSQITCFNCTLNSATQVNINTSLTAGHFVKLHRNGQTSAYKTYMQYGTHTADTSTRHTPAGYSWKMTPKNSTHKLRLPGPTPFDTFKKVVNANTQVTVKVWMMKDASYNGNQPRLILLGGVVQGISSDVIASMTESVKSITGASNASPIVITSNGHGYSTGDVVTITGVGGNTNANGTWTITVINANTFSLNGSSGNSSYTSGGSVSRWQQLTVQATPTEGYVEFYTDCDGTAGNVYVEDFTITQP